MTFTITHQDSTTKARTGLLTTKSGTIETPFFMPVATKMTAKHISSEDLESMNAKAIICNAYILSLRPGAKVIQAAGSIGEFMKYKGIVFTDSGGFQMYNNRLYISSDAEGVLFRNPFSGEKVYITPEKNMEIQTSLGGDVAMCFDSMPLFGESEEIVAEAVTKTIAWAQRCKKAHDALQNGKKNNERQLLFGITQGGIYDRLRKKSTREIAAINFDGYALGGLALGEPEEDEYRMIEIVKSLLPNEKPIYLMGAGHPLELLEAVSRGVDIFDSRYPTQNARRGTILTWQGKLTITNAQYKEDFSQPDSSCDCFVCTTYSRAYLCHLQRNEEPVGMRLASYHNLYFIHALLRSAREAIKAETFSAFKDKIKKYYG